jgi:hypothetical protein
MTDDDDEEASVPDVLEGLLIDPDEERVYPDDSECATSPTEYELSLKKASDEG